MNRKWFILNQRIQKDLDLKANYDRRRVNLHEFNIPSRLFKRQPFGDEQPSGAVLFSVIGAVPAVREPHEPNADVRGYETLLPAVRA